MKKAEEWRKAEAEETMHRAAEEVRRHKAKEAKCRVVEVVEAATKKQISLFRVSRGCWLTRQAEQVAEQQQVGAEGCGEGEGEGAARVSVV